MDWVRVLELFKIIAEKSKNKLTVVLPRFSPYTDVEKIIDCFAIIDSLNYNVQLGHDKY